MPAILYALPASHPCAAIESALRLKGLDYRRVDMLPVLAKPLQWRRFGGPTVPGVMFEDGERVLGSRDILRSLEHRAPDPPLLPADARERKRVEEAERWGDEVLQPVPRRAVWWALRRGPSSLASFARGARLGVPLGLAIKTAPPIIWAAARYNGASDEAVRADLAALPGTLDRVDGWIEEGVLGGEELNAADYQIATSLRLLLCMEDLRPALEARPGGRLAGRVAPDFPGHVGPVLPQEWLGPLRAADATSG